MDIFMNILSIFSNVTGFFSGLSNLFSTGWGFLQLIADTIGGLTEAITGLIG
ncbi:MAG: hypothetical protein LBG83_07890 [Oscillospiraceae bacterium]|jgi:hypothetical protein|nr:hypothetical protein [Oscillospiraceae bacterium]MDR0531968.1 hypothetical protein [Oscillospiraceae bacterium]